jgi:hypothetical protein
MANRSRSSAQKHHKEQARQQKQQAKAARRLEAKQRRANAQSGMDETLLDTAGTRPETQSFPVPGESSSDRASR